MGNLSLDSGADYSSPSKPYLNNTQWYRKVNVSPLRIPIILYLLIPEILPDSIPGFNGNAIRLYKMEGF